MSVDIFAHLVFVKSGTDVEKELNLKVWLGSRHHTVHWGFPHNKLCFLLEQ